MDEKSNSGDDEQHYQRQLIEIESKVRVKRSSANPVCQKLCVRQGQRRELQNNPQCHRKRGSAKKQSNAGHGCPGETFPEKTIDRSADQRKHGDQPKMEVWIHSLSRFT